MQMTLRWYGSKHDSVTLEQIRQIPGVKSVITTLYDSVPGEAWKLEDIHAMKKEVEAAGLTIAGIESVNVHDAIKIGSPDREEYIENYITTLERLGQEDIHRYVIISCLYLTGQEQNLPEKGRMVLLYLHIIRRQ